MVAATIALSCYLIAAWELSPRLPGGDEPHYLVISQSLLLDGDLRIENNHRRRDYRDGLERAEARLPPTWNRRQHLFDTCSGPAGGDRSRFRARWLSRSRRLSVDRLGDRGGAGLALRISRDRQRGAAWFAWAAVALTPPFLPCVCGLPGRNGRDAGAGNSGTAARQGGKRPQPHRCDRVARQHGNRRSAGGTAMAPHGTHSSRRRWASR